jgi:hypothetical protein
LTVGSRLHEHDIPHATFGGPGWSGHGIQPTPVYYQPTLSLCPYCGLYHAGVCLRVKSVEYHENGTIKRVEFHDIFAMKPQENAG